jgi:membrane-associated protease RseP (regulator of RpoE activity)
MTDHRQDLPNPFQPPLRLVADAEPTVPLLRLVLAGLAGFICGGLAGNLIASALFALAFALLGENRPPLGLIGICAVLGALVGAASGTVAGVRLAKTPRLRRWLMWTTGGLFAAGFLATGMIQRIEGVALVPFAVLGGFSGLIVGAVCSAFLPRRIDLPHKALAVSAQTGWAGLRKTWPIVIGLFATLFIVCLVYQSRESAMGGNRGFLGLSFHDDPAEGPNKNRQPGAVVTQVARGSSAEAAGILPGDRIIAVDEESIENAADLQAVMRARRAGETISLSLVRDDEQLIVEVQLMNVYGMDEASRDLSARSR